MASVCPRKEKQAIVNTCIVDSPCQIGIINMSERLNDKSVGSTNSNDVSNVSMKCVVADCRDEHSNNLPRIDVKL